MYIFFNDLLNKHLFYGILASMFRFQTDKKLCLPLVFDALKYINGHQIARVYKELFQKGDAKIRTKFIGEILSFCIFCEYGYIYDKRVRKRISILRDEN